jgi:hypothetical protein
MAWSGVAKASGYAVGAILEGAHPQKPIHDQTGFHEFPFHPFHALPAPRPAH